MLSVEGLSTKALLDDVSFELHQGEILGFAGLMGAGRTEVARAIVGADKATAARSACTAARCHRQPGPGRARCGIGYLSEDRKKLGVMLERNVRENIVLSSLSRYARGARVHERPRDRGDRPRVRRRACASRRRRPTSWSRTSPAATSRRSSSRSGSSSDCDVLIFDEPTRGIDVGAKDEIYALLNDLAAAGKSIIMISSELPEILRMSHRIAVMCEGRLTAILSNERGNTGEHHGSTRPASTPRSS